MTLWRFFKRSWFKFYGSALLVSDESFARTLSDANRRIWRLKTEEHCKNQH